MSAIKLESAVLDHIKNLYKHPNIQEQIAKSISSLEDVNFSKEITTLEKEISLAPEKEKRHREAYERNLESLDELEANINRIKAETARYRVERDRLLSLSSSNQQKTFAVQKLCTGLNNFDTFWHNIELDEKKLILRSIISEIRAGDGKVEIDFIT